MSSMILVPKSVLSRRSSFLLSLWYSQSTDLKHYKLVVVVVCISRHKTVQLHLQLRFLLLDSKVRLVIEQLGLGHLKRHSLFNTKCPSDSTSQQRTSDMIILPWYSLFSPEGGLAFTMAASMIDIEAQLGRYSQFQSGGSNAGMRPYVRTRDPSPWCPSLPIARHC